MIAKEAKNIKNFVGIKLSKYFSNIMLKKEVPKFILCIPQLLSGESPLFSKHAHGLGCVTAGTN